MYYRAYLKKHKSKSGGHIYFQGRLHWTLYVITSKKKKGLKNIMQMFVVGDLKLYLKTKLETKCIWGKIHCNLSHGFPKHCSQWTILLTVLKKLCFFLLIFPFFSFLYSCIIWTVVCSFRFHALGYYSLLNLELTYFINVLFYIYWCFNSLIFCSS